MSQHPVIVAGLRTPFVPRGGSLAELSDRELGVAVVAELLERAEIDPRELDLLVFGRVIASARSPNVAREIGLGVGLPPEVDAHTVSKACISSLQTAVDVHRAIESGAADVAIAGGTESASNTPILVSEALQEALNRAADADELRPRLAAFSDLGPGDLLPKPPPIAEPSTGESMGEACERMAKLNGISRQAQDRFAHRSHLATAAAWERGDFDNEVMPVQVGPGYRETVRRDANVRADSDLEKYAELPPVFDRQHGSLTAGNSSPLTDGASAVLMMSGERAEALGLEPLGRIRSAAFSASDPADQLLMGSALSAPAALDRAGMELADLDLIDMHEAFAAEVLSNVQAMESRSWNREHLGRNAALGEVDWETFNVLGGSIAVGHPFAATGTRQITQTLSELRRRGGGRALVTSCAAGGLGASLVVETDG